MGTPSRPVILDEAESCIVNGVELRHKTCTSYAVAMLIRRSTLGRKAPSGCDVRRKTGDVVGGTTLSQNAAVSLIDYGVPLAVRIGGNVCSPEFFAAKLRQGCGTVVQGNAGALVGRKTLAGSSIRTTRGNVNHAVEMNEGRGWHTVGAHLIPSEVLVYDPEADGRTTAWGKVPKGPQWWPWSAVLAYMADLRPSSTDGGVTGTVLGPGKVYCAIGPDTEPHAHLRFTGSTRTSPFPVKLAIQPLTGGTRVNVRKGPSTAYAVASRLAAGAAFSAYQVTDRGKVLTWTVNGVRHSSGRWYGDHDGTSWVHSSGVRVP